MKFNFYILFAALLFCWSRGFIFCGNKAKFFYEKPGFTVIREEDIDIGNGYFMNDYVMELIIR